jgi:hypothetical protein
MRDEAPLAKTVRMNRLFDAYRSLLTEKQRTFLYQYFAEDFTLGEIAEGFSISRQAVYEHIKRAGQLLEDYEAKLQLVRRQDARRAVYGRLRDAIAGLPADRQAAIGRLIGELERLEADETPAEKRTGGRPADDGV